MMFFSFLLFSKTLSSSLLQTPTFLSPGSSSILLENVLTEQSFDSSNPEDNVTYLKIKTKKLFKKANGTSGFDGIMVTKNGLSICQIMESSYVTLPYPSPQFKYEYTLRVQFITNNYATCDYSFAEGSLYTRTISGKTYKNKTTDVSIKYPIQKPSVSLNLENSNLNIAINHGSNQGVFSDSPWVQKEVKVLYKANFMGYSTDSNDSFYEEELASLVETSTLNICDLIVSNKKAFFNGFFEIQTLLQDATGQSTGSYFIPASFLNGKVNIFGDVNKKDYFDGLSEVYSTCPKQTLPISISSDLGLHLVFDDNMNIITSNSLVGWNTFFQLTGSNQFTGFVFNSENKEVVLTGGNIVELSANTLLKEHLVALVDTSGIIKKIGGEAFLNSQLKKVFLSDTEILSFRAFFGSKKLIEFDAPKVKNAEDGALQDCWSIQELNLPDLITAENYFCKNCYSLRLFNANNLISAYTSSFERTINLLTLSMNNLVSLGVQAFFNSSKIRTISLPSLLGLGSQAFLNTTLSSLSLPLVSYIGNNPIGVTSSLYSPGQGSFLGTSIFGLMMNNRAIFTNVSSFFTTIQDYQALKLRNTVTETVVN